MPGDPTILEEVPVPALLTTTDLLNTMAVKLPPFWPENIKAWFVQSESQFPLKGVKSSQSKFDYCVQLLLLVGKLAGWQEDAFSLPAGASGSSLIYLQALLSSLKFLVDSGASVTVFPSLLWLRCEVGHS